MVGTNKELRQPRPSFWGIQGLDIGHVDQLTTLRTERLHGYEAVYLIRFSLCVPREGKKPCSPMDLGRLCVDVRSEILLRVVHCVNIFGSIASPNDFNVLLQPQFEF